MSSYSWGWSISGLAPLVIFFTLLHYHCRIFPHSKLHVDVFLLLLNESQCRNFLRFCDSTEDHLCGFESDTCHRILSHFDVADFHKSHWIECEKVTCCCADQDMTIIVWSVSHSTDMATRLESTCHCHLYFDSVKEHQERLWPLDATSCECLNYTWWLGWFVFSCKYNLSRKLLLGSLLSVKLSILPIESRHYDEIDLSHVKLWGREEVLQFQPFNQGTIYAEDIHEWNITVCCKNVPSVVQYSLDLEVLRTLRHLILIWWRKPFFLR